MAGVSACGACGGTVADEHAHCPSCGMAMGEQAPLPVRPEPGMPALVMGGVGAMLAFFGFSFWLVAAVAEAGFWPLALGMTLVAVALFALAAASRRSQLRRWRAEREKALERSTCRYCGSRNVFHARRCWSCGAPL